MRTENSLQFGCVVPEIRSRTDRPTDRLITILRFPVGAASLNSKFCEIYEYIAENDKLIATQFADHFSRPNKAIGQMCVSVRTIR